MVAVRRLGFLKFEILTADEVVKVNTRQLVKCHDNQSNRCRDVAIFRFFNMEADFCFLKYR